MSTFWDYPYPGWKVVPLRLNAQGRVETRFGHWKGLAQHHPDLAKAILEDTEGVQVVLSGADRLAVVFGGRLERGLDEIKARGGQHLLCPAFSDRHTSYETWREGVKHAAWRNLQVVQFWPEFRRGLPPSMPQPVALYPVWDQPASARRSHSVNLQEGTLRFNAGTTAQFRDQAQQAWEAFQQEVPLCDFWANCLRSNIWQASATGPAAGETGT